MKIGKQNENDFVSRNNYSEYHQKEVMSRILRVASKIYKNSIYGGSYISCGSEVAKILEDAIDKERE